MDFEWERELFDRMMKLRESERGSGNDIVGLVYPY